MKPLGCSITSMCPSSFRHVTGAASRCRIRSACWRRHSVAAWVGRGPGEDQAGVVPSTLPPTSTAPSQSTTAPSTTTATPDGVLVIPRRISGNVAVFDVILDDGSRFAVLLPFYTEGGPVQLTAQRTSAHLHSGAFDATLSFDTCSGEVQTAGVVNERGALVAVTEDAILVRRPDQSLFLHVTGMSSTDAEAVDAFDIVPLAIGNEYAAAANEAFLGLSDPFGPITIGDVIVTASGYGAGIVTGWSLDTAVPRWTASVGTSSFLMGTQEDQVLATPGMGSIRRSTSQPAIHSGPHRYPTASRSSAQCRTQTGMSGT